MANTMAVQDVQVGERATVYIHRVTLSGSYTQVSRGSNTGEVLTPNTASNPNFLAKPSAAHYDRAYPLQGPGGFSAELIPGADDTHWLLKVYSSAGTEHVAAAYEATITGDLDFLVAFEAKNYR